MVKLEKLFELKKGSSHDSDDYEPGAMPFVTSTERNNGVMKFVTPLEDDVVFPGGVVAISGLGHATVQQQAFLPKSNGGDALTVLVPLEPKSTHWLIAFAAYFNHAHKWRFGFGRKAGSRIDDLLLDNGLIERIASQVKVEAPKPVALEASVLAQVVSKLRELYGDNPTIGDVFELKQNKPFGMELIQESGLIPVTSATEKEVNSIVGYVNESYEELMPSGAMSVTKDGKPGVARVQPLPWLSASNSVCLNPMHSWTTVELTCLAALIERQCWRFGYGRKASDGRLAALRLLDGFPGIPPCPQAA